MAFNPPVLFGITDALAVFQALVIDMLWNTLSTCSFTFLTTSTTHE